jgi:hypothetical protein
MAILKSLIFVIVVPGIFLFYIPYEIVTSPFDMTFRMGILRFIAVIPWLLGISASLLLFFMKSQPFRESSVIHIFII